VRIQGSAASRCLSRPTTGSRGRGPTVALRLEPGVGKQGVPTRAWGGMNKGVPRPLQVPRMGECRSEQSSTGDSPMSNHFSADNFKFPGDDARLDIIDLFLF
jgi:hypothetical protein